MPTNRTYSTILQVGGRKGWRQAGSDGCKQTFKDCLCICGCVNASQACGDLLIEFQVKDEGCAKGLHQEAALGQMDGLRGGLRAEESEERGKGIKIDIYF